MSDELDALHELRDAAFGASTMDDGIRAVARHVLADDASVARWRGLLGMQTPRPLISTCYLCGQHIRNGALFYFDGVGTRHGFDCPANYDTARDREAEGQRAGDRGGRFGGGGDG